MKQNKYAIISLCMINEKYIIGALISAHAHRQFIQSKQLPIDLVLMCDSDIYDKFGNTLKLFYDKVLKIDLLYYEPLQKYKGKSLSKRYNWIGYVINKWQCLQINNLIYASPYAYPEYEYIKVLFLDVDILPVNINFYDIFNTNTPAFYVHYGEQNKLLRKYIIHGSKVKNQLENISSYQEYTDMNSFSLDGGMVLLTPSKTLYDKYINYINYIFQNGMYGSHMSGSDETSLFYFYGKYNTKEYYNISDQYIMYPWGNHLNISNPYSYNFYMIVKPWLKPIFLMWKEERLWRDIYKKIQKNEQIIELFKKIILNGYQEFIKNEFFMANSETYHISENKYNLEYINKHPELCWIETFEKIIKYEKEIEIHNNDYGILNVKAALNILI